MRDKQIEPNAKVKAVNQMVKKRRDFLKDNCNQKAVGCQANRVAAEKKRGIGR